VETLMGGSLVVRKPPIVPSGRQDLNLRPLDPQDVEVVVFAGQAWCATVLWHV